MRVIEREGYKEYQCTRCNSIFSDVDDEYCSVCGHDYINKPIDYSKEKLTQGEPYYRCTSCNKKFYKYNDSGDFDDTYETPTCPHCDNINPRKNIGHFSPMNFRVISLDSFFIENPVFIGDPVGEVVVVELESRNMGKISLGVKPRSQIYFRVKFYLRNGIKDYFDVQFDLKEDFKPLTMNVEGVNETIYFDNDCFS